MTDSTTTAEAIEASDELAPDASTPAAVPAASDSSPATPVRRWRTRSLVLTGVIALVLGLGIGGVAGWAISDAQGPQFGNGQPGQFPGGGGQFPGGDGQGPGNGQRPDTGDMPQGGDDTSDSGSSNGDDS